MQSYGVKDFFADSTQHSGVWLEYLNGYTAIPHKVSDAEKFALLDKWYHSLDVRRGFITKNDLVEIMRWKLTRGKMRPLLKKIEALTEQEVQLATYNGINCLRAEINDDHIRAALNALSKPLKGIGPATASAVLALWNHALPFMSDAGLIATGNNLDYTVPTYLKYYHTLTAKVNQLNTDGHTNRQWTAKEVEAVLHMVYSRFDLKIPL
jgi:hypothetical protein